ncbi:FAD-dependent oxidoreductase [Nonomuraea sp. NPDC046570]|uniref:NAD(P)/FAD-dependent oxidoreductase n=1 Tax=Nonomuraea sp. NPDC046570 TaxID=3155255 RepID=UPI0033E82BE0
MDRDPDVLIIGGGVAGLFSAYHLRLSGCSVAVVERGPIGGPQSCSSGNTGFVGTQGSAPLAEPGVPAQGLRWLLNPESPFYIKPRPDPALLAWLWHFRRACTAEAAQASFRILLDLKQRSLAMLRDLCTPDTLTANGMVVAFKTPQAFEKAARALPPGVPLRVLEPAELSALEPGVEFDIAGALYNEEGAYLRVPSFLTELAGTLTGMGVDLHEHTEVTGFETTGHRVRQVRTTRGDFRPGETVIAAGTWSAACARKLDVKLRLQPAKGYTVTVKTSPGAPRLPVLLSEGKVALTPLGDRLRLGGTLELAGLDGRISRRRVDGILRAVRSHLPALDTSATLDTWSGFRPCTPDSLPYIGRAAPYRNLVIACGHGHIGLGLAPAGGRLVAQIVSGAEPDVDLTPFRVDRY